MTEKQLESLELNSLYKNVSRRFIYLLLQKELIPIRNDRQYPRLKTAHFRKPRYFIYRAA